MNEVLATMQVTCHAFGSSAVIMPVEVLTNDAAAPDAKPLQKLPPRAQVETPPRVPWDS